MPLHRRRTHTTKALSKRIAYAIATVAMLWVASGIFSGDDSNTAEDATRAQIAPLVRTVMSEAQVKTREVVVYGTTENVRSVTLKPQTGGKIATINATEGEFVKEGDIIATIEMDNRQAQLNKAQATVKQRTLEHKVAKGLLKGGHQSETKLAEAYAHLQTANAELLSAKLDIEHTQIRSPFAGILQETFVEKGDLVKANEGNIATIIDSSTFLVVGYVPEQKIADITVGSIAFANLVTGLKTEGIVRYVSRVADPATRTFKVEIEIPAPHLLVSEGITSELRIPTGTLNAHLVSSSYFSLNKAGEVGVKTLSSNGTVKFHPITIIGEGRDGIWVSGLPAKAQIITIGQAFLKDGDRARTAAGDQ